ncbi:MAG: ABC transporter permease [Gammaproteobacteria bacterium]|nr:ABC transporter permease [Gammaproteobacteria bacterium]
MSEAALATLTEESYSRRVIKETALRWGARTGFFWIGSVAVFAVFAPFIANSHPYLVLQDGVWSSPMLVHITWVDVSLLVTFATVMVAWWYRNSIRAGRAMGAITLVAAITACIGYFAISNPQAVVYEQYREGVASDAIESVWMAPVPYSPTDRSRDDPAPLQPPSLKHLFGTDEDGADVLSRMIHACRIALGIGFVATGIAFLIGVVYGGLMGYFAGWTEILMMRFLEIFESIPQLFLLLTVVAFFGRNIYLIMAVIGLTSWTGYARYLRAEFLKLRNQDFVQAALASGLPLFSILFRHMLPNGIAPLLVAASFGIAQAILAEATLSFLGLGVVDEASWGGMLNQAVGPGGTFSLWMATYPGLAIFFTVFAYNLIGEALRDAIDPNLKQTAP